MKVKFKISDRQLTLIRVMSILGVLNFLIHKLSTLEDFTMHFGSFEANAGTIHFGVSTLIQGLSILGVLMLIQIFYILGVLTLMQVLSILGVLTLMQVLSILVINVGKFNI